MFICLVQPLSGLCLPLFFFFFSPNGAKNYIRPVGNFYPVTATPVIYNFLNYFHNLFHMFSVFILKEINSRYFLVYHCPTGKRRSPLGRITGIIHSRCSGNSIKKRR